MSTIKVKPTGGISVASILGILFVALKLTGYIDWSWFYVTMPFWLPLTIVLGVASVFLLIGLIVAVLK